MDCAVDIIVASVSVVDGNGNQCVPGIALGGSSFGCRAMTMDIHVESGLC